MVFPVLSIIFVNRVCFLVICTPDVEVLYKASYAYFNKQPTWNCARVPTDGRLNGIDSRQFQLIMPGCRILRMSSPEYHSTCPSYGDFHGSSSNPLPSIAMRPSTTSGLEDSKIIPPKTIEVSVGVWVSVVMKDPVMLEDRKFELEPLEEVNVVVPSLPVISEVLI
jgi:hypothetical protein